MADRTDNQKLIRDFFDVLRFNPGGDPQGYLDKCVRVSSTLGIDSGIRGEKADLGENRLISHLRHSPEKNRFEDLPSFVKRDVRFDVASFFRNSCLDIVNDLEEISVSDARNVLSISSNPFSKIYRLKGEVDPAEADQLVFQINQLVSFYGSAPRNVPITGSVQVGSLQMSLEAYGKSSDTVSELSRLTPADVEIERKTENSLFPALNFSNRLPLTLFSVEYVSGGRPGGLIFGWKRIPDATTYRVWRRDVFTGEIKIFNMKTSDLETHLKMTEEYLTGHVFPLFKSLKRDDVCVFLDTTVLKDRIYLYGLNAQQDRSAKQQKIFSVKYTARDLDTIARRRIEQKLLEISRANGNEGEFVDADDVNPWPTLASFFFGDQSYDWVLSAVNYGASMDRGDDPVTLSKFSYIGAKYSALISAMDEGRFVVPVSIEDVKKNFRASIGSVGLSRTIDETLRECGVLTLLEDTTLLDRTRFDQKNPTTSKTLSAIVASVDPELATLDVRALINNFPVISKVSSLIGISADVPVDLLSFSGTGTLMQLVRSAVEGKLSFSESGVTLSDQLDGSRSR